MNRAEERIRVLYRSRLVTCVAAGIGTILASLIINPAVTVWIIVFVVFESTVNQPWFWEKLNLKLRTRNQSRLHLYADIVVATLVLHFFGGYRAGVFLAAYLLIMLYAMVAISPREGIFSAAASMLAFYIMFFLETHQVIAEYPTLMDVKGPGMTALLMTLSTVVILLVPAHVGYNIYRIVIKQEREVRKSVERYLRLFNEVWEALIIVSPEGRIELANSRAADLFHREREWLLGRDLAEVLSPESVDDFASLIHNVSSGEHVEGSNFKLSLPEGQERIVEVSASPYARDPGPPGMFFLFKDVTEQRRLEQELRRNSEELEARVEARTAELEGSKERYEFMFEKAAVPLAWLDPRGVLQSANQAFYALTGFGREIEGSLEIIDVLAERGDHKRVSKYLELHRKGYEAPTRFEMSIRIADKSVLWTEWFIRFEPLTDQHLLSMIDVTERREAEHSLKESEERYRRLIETSPDAVTMTGLDGKIIMVNQQAVKLYGAENEEDMLGLNSFEFIAPEERRRAMENAMKTLETGKIESVEYTLIRKDGSTYPGEISASLVRDARGEPRFFIGVLRDISGRKKAEQELEEHREHLAEQVRARTAELEKAYEQLRESEEKYRMLFESAPEVIALIGLDGAILDYNMAATPITGLPREQIIGKPFTELGLIRKEDIPRYTALMSLLAQGGHSDPLEVEFTPIEGEPHWLEIYPVLIKKDDKVHAIQVITRDITERKKADEALRKSEERYRLLAENASDVIWTMDLNLRFTYLSPSSVAMWGYSVEEAMELAVEQFVSRDSLDLALKALAEEIERDKVEGPDGGRSRILELEEIRQDGSTFWVEAIVTFLRDQEGKPMGVLGVTREISERKKAEAELALHRRHLEELVAERTAELQRANENLRRENDERKRAEGALRDSEEKYRTLFQNSMDAVYISNREGMIIDANQAAVTLSGYSYEELIGLDVRELYVDPDQRRAYQKTIEERGSVSDFELRLRNKQGGELDCLITASLWIDHAGNIMGYQGIIRDVTQRKRAEEYLRRSEEHFRTLIENSLDIISIINAEGMIIYESPSVERMLGYAPEEIVGRNAFKFLHPDDVEETTTMLREGAARFGATASMEFRVQHKNGSWHYMEAVIQNLLDVPLISGFVINSRDVTERKQMEEQRQELQRQLLTAEHMAAVGEIASGIVHETNSPLTAISYYAQALEKQKNMRKADREKIQKIQESADRIERLLARIINYAGALKLDFKPVDMNDIIRQVLDAIAHEIEMRPGASLSTNLDEGLKLINGESGRLFELISNLVMNALQALADETGEVTVSTRMHNGTVVIEIKDNGVGISEEDLANIFTPFYSRRKKGGGTGLGLAIVARIVALHKGEMDVESEPGQGTVFYVRLPALSNAGK